MKNALSKFGMYSCQMNWMNCKRNCWPMTGEAAGRPAPADSRLYSVLLTQHCCCCCNRFRFTFFADACCWLLPPAWLLAVKISLGSRQLVTARTDLERTKASGDPREEGPGRNVPSHRIVVNPRPPIGCGLCVRPIGSPETGEAILRHV